MNGPITSFKGEYAFLSNFYLATIVDRSGKQWPSVEHAFQALKTQNPTEQDWVRAASTPKEARRRGRSVHMDPNWDRVKLGVMERVLLAKFRQHPQLRALLLATGQRPLVEGNWWHDTFWGVCTGNNCRKGPHDPLGENRLGSLLETVRETLR